MIHVEGSREASASSASKLLAAQLLDKSGLRSAKCFPALFSVFPLQNIWYLFLIPTVVGGKIALDGKENICYSI